MILRDLFSQGNDDIVSFLGGIYEHSEWVALSLVKEVEDGDEPLASRITSVSALATNMKRIVDAVSPKEKLNLLCAHPDLGAKVERLKELSEESQEEQSSAGLQSMEGEELDKFHNLNSAYREKFGFPFILAVRNSTKYTVLSALEGRLPNSRETEMVTALQQVHKIAWMRILSKVESNNPEGYLTCHVLDTANGCPANKMRITLTRLSPAEVAGPVGDFTTNDDGRLEGGPALKGKQFEVGTYEWIFFVGDYFASKGNPLSGTPFLDEVPIRFGIDNPDEHYHVPLLVSPWGFSTYRGS